MRVRSRWHEKQVTLPVTVATLFIGMALIKPVRAQTESSQLLPPTEQFNIYCTYNGDNTGECTRTDNNQPLSCEYASQDFIQCRSPKGYLATCLYFDTNQFACRRLRDAEITPKGQCNNPLDSSNSCRPPVREKFSNPLTPLPKALPNDGVPGTSDTPRNPFRNPLNTPF